MALTPSGPASNAGANMSPAASVAAKPMPSGSASPARTAGPGPSSRVQNASIGQPTNMSTAMNMSAGKAQPSPVIVSTSKPADQHIQTLGQNINNHINSINTQAANKPPINPASISTPPINIQKNAQGLTPQQMSQQATNQMQQRVIGAAQAAPGTLQTGAQMGSLQTGTGQTPVTFQAQTTTPETTRNAQIAEVARLNGISPEEAAQRVDNASKNGGAGLPPGVAYDRTTGQAFDVKTGAIYQGSTGPDFQGMRFQDSGTYTNPQTGETTSTGMGGGGMGSGAGTTQSSQDQLSSLNSQSDQAYADYTSKIASIQNGTFPLNPSQQATLNSITNNLNQLRSAQMAANQNYVTATNIAGLTSGRSRYAPEIQAGELQQAVSEGIAKIGKIENDASQQLLQAQASFQKEDYTEATNSYDMLQKHLDAKSSEISKMMEISQKAAEAAQKQQMDMMKFEADQKHQALTDTLASDAANRADKQQAFNEIMSNKTYDQKDKQQAFDNLMKSQDFSYKEKEDAIKNNLENNKFLLQSWKDHQDITLKEQASNPLGDNGFGVTPVKVSNTTGAPNPAQQKQFLDQLPQNLQSTIKGLTDYTSNPKNLPLKQREQMLALAHQYDPSFSENEYDARAKYNQNYTSGDLMKTRNAINTGIFHLNELKKAQDALQNAHFQGGLFGLGTAKYNTIKDMLAAQSGDPRVSAFQTAAKNVASELAAVYKPGGTPTDSEIEAQYSNMGFDKSPEQMNAVTKTTLDLLAGKLATVRDDYTSTMGKPPPDNIIKGGARDAINELQKAGIDVNIDKLDPKLSPTGQVQYSSLGSFASSLGDDQKKAAADIYDKMKADGADDSQILDLMQQQFEDNGGGDSGGGFNEVGGDTNQATNVNKIAEAIGKFESGGRYNALGPVMPSGAYAGDRAIGKYQIMGRNVPSWTKQALGYSMSPKQFLNDQDAQDKTARYFMQQHLNKYGRPEDVASIWLSGRPMANNQARDLATGISVPQYIKNVMKNYNS